MSADLFTSLSALMWKKKGFFQGGVIRGIPLRVQGRIQFRVAQAGEVLGAGGRVLNLLDLSDVFMTFFVPDADAVDLESFGPVHEHHPLYPQRTNVEVVQVVSPQEIILRIWERGTGITLASGSCSCAAVVAAARRGLTGRHVRVNVPGGQLEIDWREDGVWMTGPTAYVFDGVWRG